MIRNSHLTDHALRIMPSVNWTTKFTTTTGDSGADVITFAASSARYVKMNSTAWTHVTERNRLQEIEVYQ